jgi:FAD/FMN-containing dehydrogenase
MTSSRVHVTKLAAAQRQLRAAIRLFFAEEDDLAVHTVASAAYGLITDLKNKRGRDEVADYYLVSVFYVVRDYRRGTLPSHFTEDPEAMKWIREIAEQLPFIAESTKVEDVRVAVSQETAKQYWLKRNRVANFLKHADRDPRAHVPIDEVDNFHLIMRALVSYGDLVNDDLGPEGLMLSIYSCVVSGNWNQFPRYYQDMASKLAEVAPDKRLAFCSFAVSKLNASNTQTPKRVGC